MLRDSNLGERTPQANALSMASRAWKATLILTDSRILILGLRLGKIREATTPIPYEPSFQWMIHCPSILAPKRLVALGQVQRYLDMFEYGYDKAFQQLGCSTRVKFKP